MTDNLLSEIFPSNLSDPLLNISVINRNFWGSFNRSDYKPKQMYSMLSENEFNKMMDKIEERISNFYWLKLINIFYLLTISFGILSIPLVFAFFAIKNSYFTTESATLLTITIIATEILVLGFLTVIRRGLLKYYTKKIKRILTEINNSEMIARNLFLEVSEFCLNIKLNEFVITSPATNLKSEIIEKTGNQTILNQENKEN